jgi:hypothetical protein
MNWKQFFLNIKADEIIDPDNSIVRYVFTSRGNGKVFMDIRYDSEHKEIENVDLIPEKTIQSGKINYELDTNRAEKILITFFINDYKVNNALVDTDFRPNATSQNPDIFLIRSDKGYFVRLTFTWDEHNNIDNVNIKPEDNPYD